MESSKKGHPMTASTAAIEQIDQRTIPRWAVILAHIAALTPVLSSLWRLPLIFAISMGLDDIDNMMSYPLWVRAGYLIGLGVLSEGLAFLTVGLVRPWGETVPHWVPVLRGRSISARLVVSIATVGGLAATVIFTAMAVAWRSEERRVGDGGG